MNTKLFEILSSCDEKIKEVADILIGGGVCALPTETVYGLAANALDETAVKKIFKAKNRPCDNPLIVHIANKEDVNLLAKDINNDAKKCMDAFWPGPFTVILNKKDIVPSVTSGGLNTVAIRMPSNKIIAKVIEKSGLFLAAPSANLSGSPSPTNAYDVIDDMQGRIEGIVISDDCDIGLESTVVSFIEENPRLLRPGFITLEQLKKVCPNIMVDDGVLNQINNKKVHSPGLKYKHYAPKCELTLISSSSAKFCKYANQKELPVICLKEDEEKLKVPFISLKDKPYKELFSALRRLDKLEYKKALCHAPQKNGVGLAIFNRLIRSCGFNLKNIPTVVALTGPSGVGKTTFGLKAKEMGFYCIDCDLVAKEVVPTLKNELIDAFSEDILTDGILDRKKLAAAAFKSNENTELLNSITLKPIVKKIEELINNCNSPYVILDGATIIESGIHKKCDYVVSVLASEEFRIKRFKERDKLTDKEASLRASAKKHDSFYESKSDYVIYNDGSIENFEKETENILNTIIFLEGDFNGRN